MRPGVFYLGRSAATRYRTDRPIPDACRPIHSRDNRFTQQTTMHHFAYRDGALHAEDVDLAAIADAVGTPFYCYASATLERHYKVFASAFADVPSLVCYAMKANSNQAVLTTLARLGSGMDVVSEGELR